MRRWAGVWWCVSTADGRSSASRHCLMLTVAVLALWLPLALAIEPMLPGGCELLKLPAGSSPSTDEDRGCFNDWKDEKRLLRHGVPGCCGGPDTFCMDKPPADLNKDLWDGKCDETKMTPAMCGAMCWALGDAATDGPYTLAGVESGNQCFCDHAKNPAYPEGNKRSPSTECNMPCTGSPAEMCGGSSRVEIYKISCGSDWGWVFLIALFVGGLGYVGGGSVYNVKTKGMEPGLGALPHPAFWKEVKALVEDGVRYSSVRIAEARSGGSADAGGLERRSSYTSLSEAKESADSAVEGTVAPAPVPAPAAAAEQEEDNEEEEHGSDDSLVE